MEYISHNGLITDRNAPVLHAANRGFKYGDGVFETMRMCGGTIVLWALHLDRLLQSLALLKIVPGVHFPAQVAAAIEALHTKNHLPHYSKIRLAIYRQDDNSAGFLVEQLRLESDFFTWNEKGWRLSVFPEARKAPDVFANLKSANYLPYVMARLYAEANGDDESLVLNSNGSIADGAHTNIFIVHHGVIITPPLSSGCVAGVMRRFLTERLEGVGRKWVESNLGVNDLAGADEVFLTNAVQGVRWVQHFGPCTYTNEVGRSVFDLLSDLRPSIPG